MTTADDLARFRRTCAHFRWLAVFMVATVGLVLALTFAIAPFILSLRGDPRPDRMEWAAQAIWALPSVFYLFAVWSIGSGLGELSRGRLIQPTLASTLRRVGLALGLGGVCSVFFVTNLVRMIGQARGGYLHFDVPGMTLGMIGGALFLVGRVIDQAGRVQAELDEMI